jgi:hypothetical protein
VTVASTHEQSAQQTIDARLWQDPFEAVDNALDKPGKRDPEQQCPKNPSNDSPCKLPLKEGDKETLVLGVTVSGAPYFEDAEQRRRTRYAVLAGLERARFVPRDARHINYFLWPQVGDNAPPSPALEIPLFAMQPLLQPYQQPPYRSEAGTIAPSQHTAVPYEWFDGNKSILVLWLKEEVLKGKPLTKLLELKTILSGANYNGDIKLIGPYSSDILYDMVKETRTSIDPSDPSCRATEHKWHALKEVKFYAYGASAPDDQLLKDLTGRCQSYH